MAEYKPKTELMIKQKIEDMIVYGNICLKQFPKAERYAMAADIRRCMYTLLGLVVAANKRYYKKNTLQEIDVELDTLRTFIRLAANKDLRYLSVEKYGNWAAMVDEIGKMLGGWFKSISQ